MHDVVVVGGSLAGAATALHLAEAGRSVVLLEQRAGFRRKACGEGLFPLGVAELASLGVLAKVAERGRLLEGVRFHAGGNTATAGLGSRARPALGVRREVLDPLLLARAVAAGVEVRSGVTVTGLARAGRTVAGVETAAGVVPARAVVGADGLHSRVRRLAALDTEPRGSRYGMSAHVLLTAEPPPLVEVHFHRGYEVYVTPVGGREANVAVLLGKEQLRVAGGRLGELFGELTAGIAVIAGGDLLDDPRVAGPSPVSARRAWRANLALVGDAAGFFDGITGEGMSLALVSARDCARAIDLHLKDCSYEPLRQYDVRRSALARNAELLARVSLLLGSRPALAARSVANLARRPATFEKLVAINSGEAGLTSLRPRDLLALALGR